MKVKKYMRVFFITLFFLLPATVLFAQTASGSLRGQVTDPSGAAIRLCQRDHDSRRRISDRGSE